LLGCRSTDPQTRVEPTVDQDKAEGQAPAASARAEDKPPSEDLGAYYDGPISPEGYRLVKEADRREPPEVKIDLPDLPPEEKEKLAQTLATVEEFVRYLEGIDSFDYCRVAAEIAPMDAWGAKFRVSCRSSVRGITSSRGVTNFRILTLGSAGPDRVDRSKDDVRWGIIKKFHTEDNNWTINKDVGD
jgi:hypothetical protein